jgi:hypothetical protein
MDGSKLRVLKAELMIVLALSACLGKISTNQLPKLPNPFALYKKDNVTFVVLVYIGGRQW